MEFLMKENGFMMETGYGALYISTDNECGFLPIQLIVASIVGCSASMLRKVLVKMRMDFSDIKVSAQVERNAEEANRIENLHLHFVIQGKELRQEKVEKALALARKNCGMLQSVDRSITVTESFELVE